MKTLLVTATLIIFAGCSPLTARTKVNYTSPDGRVIVFESDRDYQGLKLHYVLDDSGKVKEVVLEVAEAGSPAGLAATALQQNLKLMELLEKLSAAKK